MSVRQKKQELLEAMHRARAMEPSSFVPNKLLDTLIQRMRLKNDAELCRVLEVQPPIISKIRHRKLNVGATILLRMHEKSNIPIRELKELTAEARAQAGGQAGAQPGAPASTHTPNRTHH